jgi:hypothetical protein
MGIFYDDSAKAEVLKKRLRQKIKNCLAATTDKRFFQGKSTENDEKAVKT